MSGSATLPWLGMGGFYDTQFPSTESPISQGGIWVLGGSVGLDWSNPQTVGGSPGFAFDTETFTGADNDSIAHLISTMGFGANHEVTHILSIGEHGTDDGQQHEVEGLMRFNITAHSATGYECLMPKPSAGYNPQLVRWNGALGAFTIIDQLTAQPAMSNGDSWKVRIVGSIVTAYYNGVQQNWTGGWPGFDGDHTRVDVQNFSNNNGGAYYATGNPGMGFFNNSGSPGNRYYCSKRFTATNV